MKKTVLYDEHVKLGAKMHEYAGYLMPIEYSGLALEHQAVRKTCGLFDVSHMGEVLIKGVDAKRFCNYLITNTIDGPMRMTYALMLNESGGIIDDLMAYMYTDEDIMLVINANNIDKDLAWIKKQAQEFAVEIIDASPYTSQLALQGKSAVEVLKPMSDYDISNMKMFDFETFAINSRVFLVSRSGYTGEDGFEIYGPEDDILYLFKELIKQGVTPCGLGARDTLRFEANLPLYGHEMSENITPLEATLKFAVDLEKDFIGKQVLVDQTKTGIKQKIVGLEIIERGIARSGYEVVVDDKIVGYITSGYMIPTTKEVLALAMLDEGYWKIGQEVGVRVRKNIVKASIRNKKFLNKKYKK